MQNMADALSANCAAIRRIFVTKNLIGSKPISQDGQRYLASQRQMPPDNRPAIIEAGAQIRVELIFDFAARPF